jgi:hypothetical protein
MRALLYIKLAFTGTTTASDMQHALVAKEKGCAAWRLQEVSLALRAATAT